MTGADKIVDRAIDWHLRLGEASAEEWRDFVVWLEADESHRIAYDRITLDDALLSPSAALDEAPIVAKDAVASRSIYRWSMAGGAAIAAALLVAVLLPRTSAAEFYAIETAPGVSRHVALADGTSIDMNGGSRLKLKRGDARFASLESGEATFHVRHDPDRAFELTSGQFTIRDLGTMFNVTRDGSRLAVQVAEGAVMFEPDDQAVMLKPGMALNIRDGDDRPALGTVPTNYVGSWRRRVLSFRSAPVRDVASAIIRSTGVRVKVDDRLADRSFTGTIQLTGKSDVVIPRFAAIMDVDWRRDGEIWMLTPRSNEEQ